MSQEAEPPTLGYNYEAMKLIKGKEELKGYWLYLIYAYFKLQLGHLSSNELERSRAGSL
jgi:hypothetical protein